MPPLEISRKNGLKVSVCCAVDQDGRKLVLQALTGGRALIGPFSAEFWPLSIFSGLKHKWLP